MATTVYLGLGGNVGDVKERFHTAHQLMKSHKNCSSIRESNIYKTAPWGKPNQPDFLNSVIELIWNDSIDELMYQIVSVENKLGRNRKDEIRWGPRKIDIDLLIFGDVIIHSDELTVPHPRIADRLFVLIPLAELAPSLIPPGWERSVNDQVELCTEKLLVRELSPFF